MDDLRPETTLSTPPCRSYIINSPSLCTRQRTQFPVLQRLRNPLLEWLMWSKLLIAHFSQVNVLRVWSRLLTSLFTGSSDVPITVPFPRSATLIWAEGTHPMVTYRIWNHSGQVHTVDSLVVSLQDAIFHHGRSNLHRRLIFTSDLWTAQLLILQCPRNVSQLILTDWSRIRNSQDIPCKLTGWPQKFYDLAAQVDRKR